MIKISGSTNQIDMNGASLVDAGSVESLSVLENGVGLSSKAATADIGVANSSLVKTALNASGTAPIYACRAWVNFNGTGTVSIGASGNVSSITDNGVGDYTVNFTTAMQDKNYSISANGQADQDNYVSALVFIRGSATAQNYITTSSVRILVSRFSSNGNADIDFSVVNVNVFR